MAHLNCKFFCNSQNYPIINGEQFGYCTLGTFSFYVLYIICFKSRRNSMLSFKYLSMSKNILRKECRAFHCHECVSVHIINPPFTVSSQLKGKYFYTCQNLIILSCSAEVLILDLLNYPHLISPSLAD